jgi:hypothetical protein
VRNDERLIAKNASPLNVPELLACAQAEGTRLGAMTRWEAAFRHATAELPILVARLDQPGTYYCLAAFRIGPGITGRIRLNAYSGKYAEATGVAKRGQTLTRFQTPDDVWSRLFPPRSRTARGGTRRMPVIEPMLVWQPSQQSRTPFLPFYQVKDGRKTRFFRVDGPDFDALYPAVGN